ncbi:MAG: Phage terminase large subunit (GpA) [Candidatus Kentron sp. G]|nr:MAG: Phage terminase large subunit (GpA) [Candidatus Kentron sp. G]VFM98186.1 MAG: Phage terminase large subunit (GpA) [Candidatus Kentron sp. G]
MWEALDKLVFGPFKYENGNRLRAKAISIDSSDGNTNDAVYYWVRTRSAKHSHVRIMAVKGSSERQDPEIFATPRLKSIDHHRPDKQTKADRHGVKVYIVGTDMSALCAKAERGWVLGKGIGPSGFSQRLGWTPRTGCQEFTE